MAIMNKSKQLTEMCYKQIKDLNILVELQGNWFVFPPDIPVDLSKCDKDYLKELLDDIL